MFVNANEVKDITGLDVTSQEIVLAQHIIEAFVGRNESEVSGADDYALMAKAVAFQTAYMQNNYDRIYDQVALIQQGTVDGQMTLDRDMAAPFIAPLAVLALRNLTWRRSRSIKTGSMFGRSYYVGWERD